MNSIDLSARCAALLISACVLGSVAGCGDVTFKRGAGPDAMQTTEQSCRAKTADVEAYAGCLRAAGYAYAKQSESGALFVDGDENVAGAGSAALPDPAAVAETLVQVSTTAPDSTGSTPLVSIEPSGRAGQPLPQTTKIKAKLNRDPLAAVTVASWWKLGGTAAGLEADQGLCAGALGDGHRVASNAKVVTVGMLRCLKDKGWFAVGR